MYEIYCKKCTVADKHEFVNPKSTVRITCIFKDELPDDALNAVLNIKDIKAFLNDKDFKLNTNNKPRIFANTVSINKKNTFFEKSIFTLCDYRENDKCPPWTIQSSKMLHDSQKKQFIMIMLYLKFIIYPFFIFLNCLIQTQQLIEDPDFCLPPSLIQKI